MKVKQINGSRRAKEREAEAIALREQLMRNDRTRMTRITQIFTDKA